MLSRLGRTLYRRRRWVVLTWLVAAVAMLAVGSSVFSRLGIDYRGSAMESFAGFDKLADSAPYSTSITAAVDGLSPTAPEAQAAVATATRQLQQVDHLASVVTPATPGPAGARQVAADGRAFLITVNATPGLDTQQRRAFSAAVTPALRGLETTLEKSGSDVRVVLGGGNLGNLEEGRLVQEDTERGELIALPITLVVMILLFAGFLAASIPILAALASVAGGLFALLGFSHLLQLDPSVASVTTVMGLGLSIDYALLLVSRFREERARGYDAEESLARMMATAGRTILFSALTVAVSLSGLFFFDVIVYKGLAAAGLSVVVFALLAALTLVPALIAVFAKRIKPTRASGADDGFFARLARTTQRRPIPVVVAVALVLLIAGTPFLGAHYRLGGVELLPTDSEARQFSDLIDARFPQSAADPLLVVAHVPASQLAAYTTEVTQRPDVAPHLRAVLPPQDRLHGWSSVAVIAKGDPQGEDAQALVHALREHRPAFRTWVTGNGAVLVDLSAQVAAGVWKAALWVGLATFVLLFLMTGSVLVPLKALVMNTLSLGATFGALIWIFQEGHLSGLLGFTPVGGLETWLPVMVFAFAFGLSMDYEVFLLSRIKELYDSGLPNDRAVELGLQRTGRIITSAALLVVIVFAGFAAGRTMTIKEIGVALAIAVAVDATLVRCLLVPATMTLLGDLNWWAPGPLRRLHARIGLREHTDLPAPRAPEAAAPPTRSTVA